MGKNSSRLRNALFVGIICGVAGVLVDVDHVISHYSSGEKEARYLHSPLLILSSGILICCYTYITGLLCKKILIKLLEDRD